MLLHMSHQQQHRSSIQKSSWILPKLTSTVTLTSGAPSRGSGTGAIAQDMVATALCNCCHDHLRTYIMRDVRGNIPVMTEDVLLGHIKRLDVQEESILMQRMKLSKNRPNPPGPESEHS